MTLLVMEPRQPGCRNGDGSRQAAASLPADVARERISDALRHLDDTIHEIRDHIFRFEPPGSPR